MTRIISDLELDRVSIHKRETERRRKRLRARYILATARQRRSADAVNRASRERDGIVAELAGTGLSAAQLGDLLGMSRQRAHQLLAAARAALLVDALASGIIPEGPSVSADAPEATQ